MEAVKTALAGVFLLRPKCHRDSRGFFYRAFEPDSFEPYLGTRTPPQVNLSENTIAGTVRGLHFQAMPWTETKIVQCVSGRIWDVVVDLRKNSPTFLKSLSFSLTPEDPGLVVIPQGCAHGFQSLEDSSKLLYIHSGSYHQEAESGFRYDDPLLGISWPHPVTQISDRDLSLPSIRADFKGIEL